MDREYSSRLESIENILGGILPGEPAKAWSETVFPGLDLDPARARALLEPGRELLGRGGKRWRPLLSLLVCESLGGGGAVLPLLPLVELPHNASLIHDDIEDNSDERRGRPAIHLLYGNDTAINSGCFLYFLPLACLEQWDAPASKKNRIWSLWASHMRRLHLGQSMDISWHRDFLSLPSIDEYMLMCGLKTGCLARFAAALGAAAAAPDEAVADAAPEAPANADALVTAAEKLGVGFQILDDVKNLTTGIPGKKRGDDIVEGKKSLPVLLYIHGGGPEKQKRAEFTASCFKAAGEGSAACVEEFIGCLAASGVLEEARIRGETLVSEAGKAFSGYPLLAGITGLLSPETE
jgi:octaprenyl-diphosphate synthase